jgi:hypothetical protein
MSSDFTGPMPGTTFSYFTGLPEGPWIWRNEIFEAVLRAE